MQLHPNKRIGIFITANTNRRATPQNVAALREAMAHFLQSPNGRALFHRQGGDNTLPLLVDANRPYKSTYRLENLDHGRLHAHGYMDIKYPRFLPNGDEQHYWISYSDIRAFLQRRFTMAGGQGGLPYIDIVIRGLSTDNGWLYVHKDDEEAVAASYANIRRLARAHVEED